MERFVELSVAGGLALVAGLWVVELAAPGTAVWIAGIVLSVAGVLSLAVGIGRELDAEW